MKMVAEWKMVVKVQSAEASGRLDQDREAEAEEEGSVGLAGW